MKKLREWNAETITANISQFVNRYVPKQSNAETVTKQKPVISSHGRSDFQSPTIPAGISTISGGIIETSNRGVRDKSKDNHGLYALKCDRNAAKKGLLLAIPLKNKHKRAESKVLVHEKFQSCERLESEDGSLNDCEEEVLRIEVESPPTAPPRRRRSQDKGRAPQIPVLPNIEANQSVQRQLKERKESVDIFKKQDDVFREFDKIFINQPSQDSIPHISDAGIRPKLRQDSSSFSSSIEESYEEVKRKAVRRLSSTIRVQDFNDALPRCRSITSPKHPPTSCDSSFEVIEQRQKKPTSILKKTIPINKPLIPEKPIRTVTKKVDPKPSKRFFVYYNDEDELVFNKTYTGSNNKSSCEQKPPQLQLVNHADALFKHYYTSEYDNARNGISTEGIFI